MTEPLDSSAGDHKTSDLGGRQADIGKQNTLPPFQTLISGIVVYNAYAVFTFLRFFCVEGFIRPSGLGLSAYTAHIF